jgi:hypothetical protein
MHSRSGRAPVRRFALFLSIVAMLALIPSAASAARHHHRRAHSTGSFTASVRAAARHSNRADRRLVAQARALRACLRSGSPCTRLHANVQRAGHAFTVAQRNLARKARRSAQRRAVSSAVRTPTLRASGYKLSWNAVSEGRGYWLVTAVPGQPYRYSYVRTTSATPPPVPGQTVTYAVRVAVSSSHWSNLVKISYPAAPPAPTPTPPAGPPAEELNLKAAPALHVSGQTLQWNLVANVTAYILMTHVPGQAEAFTAVSGTSTTPPAVPGKTVTYSVRTAVDGSAWAPTVTIAYPAPPPPKEPPPPAPKETGFSVSGTEGFQPGINSGTNPQDYTGTAFLGAKIVRIEMGIGAPASAWESIISKYAAQGVRVAPLAGFAGRLPSATEAQNLASWARAYGPGGTFWAKRSDGNLAIQTIEFGNETSYGYQYHDNAGAPSYQARAQTYAVRLKEAAEAIGATGIKVGVLAVADDPSGNWMNGMFQAVPNLGNYVSGWVTHPYGTYGKTKLLGVINQTAAHGAPSSIPIDITEWGISSDAGKCLSDNYGFNPCMTYDQAAEQLKASVAEIKSLVGRRLRLFELYQIRDQQLVGASTEREAYFGLLQHELQPKGAYTTAAQELLAL